ncbi:MAG: hypothetical protein H8E47_14215 [Anaerolineales bacterium]|nr:hypothetical protein [Anaerolineales bacterium]
MSTQHSRERHLLTLLMMPGLGLFKPHDLNTYTGQKFPDSRVADQLRPCRFCCILTRHPIKEEAT